MGPDFGTVGLQTGWRSAYITTDNLPNNSDKKLWRQHVAYQGREYNSLSSIQIRLAAVYLNYAECCFETGDPGYAFSDFYVPNPHTRRNYEHNPNRELYPIPYDELMKNPALDPANDQNPGY